MNFFDQALKLVTEPPGDLVYYLVTLFALEAILAMALGEWLRGRRTPSTRRWLLAGGGMFLTRGVLMVVVLLIRQEIVSSVSILPLLERFMDVVVLLFLGWAALTWSDEHPVAATGLLLGSLLVGLIGYAATATSWYETATNHPETIFNGSAQDTLWTVVALGILGFVGLGILISPNSPAVGRSRRGLAKPSTGRWGLLLGSLLLMMVGYGGHLIASDESNIAGWVRLTNLAAYPLLAGLVYRRVLDWQRQDLAMVVQEVSPKGFDLNRLGAFNTIGDSLDLDTTLVTAASTIATVLKADVCALGLPKEQTNRRIELAVVHTPDHFTEEGGILDLDSQPLIKHAIRTRRQVISEEAGENEIALFAHMGLTGAGPLLIQPLIDNRTVVGVLLAGNPQSQHLWDEYERRLGTALGQQVAVAIGNAQRFQQAKRHAEQLAQSARLQEQENKRISVELKQAQKEAKKFAQQVYDLEKQIQRKERQTQELATILEMTESEDNGEALQAEVDRLNGVRVALEAEIQEWQEKVTQLTVQQSLLGDELVESQHQMEELQAKLEQSVELDAPQAYGIIVSNQMGQVAAIHGAIERVLDGNRSAIIGKPINDLFLDPRWRQALERLMVDEDVHHQLVDSPRVLNIQHGDQSMRVELTPVPAPHAQGFNSIVAVIYGEGSDPQVSYHAELVASLVQELRTPMTSIVGYTDLLLGESVGILGAMQRKFLQRVRANTERMNARLEDLIEITTIDSGRLKIEPETINVVNIIEEAIMNTAGQFRERGITVDIALDDDLPEIHADPDALNQVMLNLLSNACQASEVDTSVVVSANLQNTSSAGLGTSDHVMVSVSDSGGGIAEEDRQRVFTRLYRADNRLINGLGETGVGLSVAKTLIEAHGGRIWVESKEGVGSTFSLLLPVEGPDTERASASSLPHPRGKVGRRQDGASGRYREEDNFEEASR